MKTNLKLLTILIASCIFAASGCKKTDTNSTSSSGMLMLHIHSNLDSNEVDPGTYYPAPSSTSQIQFSHAQFYMANIKLLTTAGAWVTVNGVHLIKWGTEDYEIGNVPVGSYKTISFSVGLPSGINHTPTSSYPADSVLADQNPSMHFSTTTEGYVFMLFDGTDSLDTSTKTNFTYRIGEDSRLQTITMPDHTTPFTVSAGGGTTIHMIADYAKFIDGVSPLQWPVADNHTQSLIANTLATNIQGMFTYEE
jgi:hypothetical protein